MTAADARLAVLYRDGFACVAPKLDPDAGPCFDAWGRYFSGVDPTGIRLEVDRVRDHGSRTANHSDATTMAAVCAGHHRGTGPNAGFVWATSKKGRRLLREYLARVNEAAA